MLYQISDPGTGGMDDAYHTWILVAGQSRGNHRCFIGA